MSLDEKYKTIVIAAIRRHSMDIDMWNHTRLLDKQDSLLLAELSCLCSFSVGELPLLYSHIDPANWTLVTTRRVCYSTENQISFIAVSNIDVYKANNFKGYDGQKVERMEVYSQDGVIHHCPFETGKASVGLIYAVKTLYQLISVV